MDKNIDDCITAEADSSRGVPHVRAVAISLLIFAGVATLVWLFQDVLLLNVVGTPFLSAACISGDGNRLLVVQDGLAPGNRCLHEFRLDGRLQHRALARYQLSDSARFNVDIHPVDDRFVVGQGNSASIRSSSPDDAAQLVIEWCREVPATQKIRCVAFLENGASIFTMTGDGASLHDATSGKCLNARPSVLVNDGGVPAIRYLAVAKDGNQIVALTGSGIGENLAYDVSESRLIPWKSGRIAMTSVALRGIGKEWYFSDVNGMVHVMGTSGTSRPLFRSSSSRILAIEVLHSNTERNALAVLTETSLELHSLTDGTLISASPCPGLATLSRPVLVSQDGSRIVCVQSHEACQVIRSFDVVMDSSRLKLKRNHEIRFNVLSYHGN